MPQCLGGDPAQFNVSCVTVCRLWVNSRKKIAGTVKPTFKPVAHTTVHWDDKLPEDICSKEVVDRQVLSLESGVGVVWVRRSFSFCSLLSSCDLERKQSSQICVLRHHVSQQWTKKWHLCIVGAETGQGYVVMCMSPSHCRNFGCSGRVVPVSIQRSRDNIDFHAVPEQLRIYRQIKQAVRINQGRN